MLVDIDFVKPDELNKDDFADKLKFFPTFISDNFPMEEIIRIYDKYIYPRKIQDGIYNAWNLDAEYFSRYCKNFRFKDTGVRYIGSADDIIQIKSKYSELFGLHDFLSSNVILPSYVILVCEVKQTQLIEGRPIKWSDCPNYTGTYKKTSEYLKDETNLPFVLFYKIVELEPFTNIQ